MLRLRSTLCLVLATALASPAALAQPRPPAPPQPAPPPTIRSQLSGDARDAWDRAQQLLRAKNYEGALVEFTRAYDLSKNPRVLFNVGICEKGLNHYARAAKRFDDELRLGEGQLSDDEKQELKDAIAIVKKYVSTVAVTSTEAGAHLFVDGYDVGTTPFAAPVTVDVGRRELTMKKDGFVDLTKTVDVNAGVPAQADFALEPKEKKGTVSITVTGAPAATILMDGTDMGPAPFKGAVPVGRHTFTAHAFGYVDANQTSDVGYKDQITIVLNMTTERHEGRVRIDANPSGSIIEIDGKPVGSTHWEGTLPTGGHQLIVKKAGYEPFSQEISLKDDQVREVRATLLEAQRKDWVWWTIGTLAVIGGGAVVSYFVFKPAEPTPYVGTLQPGITTGSFRLR
jgi:hypothetical protein